MRRGVTCREAGAIMNQTLIADDLLPLVLKLPRDEQVRLAQRILDAAARGATPPAENSSGHPVAGIYRDGGYRKGADNQTGNKIEHGMLGSANGRRHLELEGIDKYNQKFTVIADEQDMNSGTFEGTWHWHDDENRYELVLRLYGDPAGKFALVGEYEDSGQKRKRYCWLLELHPRGE
jgi:hypothetical protein